MADTYIYVRSFMDSWNFHIVSHIGHTTAYLLPIEWMNMNEMNERATAP